MLSWTNCLLVLGAAVITGGTAASASAQSEESRFTVHGYLNQAYARSDKQQIYGIPKTGIWDYRTIAVQGRYALTDDDNFVVQLRNRHIGASLSNDQDVALDWAYYQHDFGILKARVGKSPIPLGMYNEVRSVGTVLPFYRAPASFFLEGIETIEGVTLMHQRSFGDWSIETTVYGGAIRSRFQANAPPPVGAYLYNAQSQNNIGAQLWINTPIKGVRFGGSALRFQLVLPTDTTNNKIYVASFDATFDRAFLRAEYEPTYNIAGISETQNHYYVHGGVNVIGGLSLNGQVETATYHDFGIKYRQAFDRAVSVNYAVQPNVVFKIEGHKNTGYNFDTFRSPTDPPGESNYGIASLSVSF
jgi:hypothetical protein